MSQKKMCIMLKGITILAAVIGIVFLTVLMPMLAVECRRMDEESAYLFWPGLCYGWLIGIMCYIALFQFWKICNEIGKDNSFSAENVNSLNIISKIAIMVTVLWFAGLVGLIIIGSMSIGFFILMSVAVMVSMAVSIIATVLAHLVQKAYELKKDADLTI